MPSSNWDPWPCVHACTAFFHIDASAVRHLVPNGLTIAVDKQGRAEIELGYVRFREGTHGLPATEEMAWAIAVKRKSGFGYAFYAVNIAADNEGFLKYNEGIGFNVHRPPARFRSDLERRSFHVEDDEGPICTLRHQPEGSLTLPFFPVNTEVWTGVANNLYRRLFKWKGMARVHFAASAATTLYDHSFFRGAPITRANPIPSQVFSSTKVAAHAAQLFTPGLPA